MEFQNRIALVRVAASPTSTVTAVGIPSARRRGGSGDAALCRCGARGAGHGGRPQDLLERSVATRASGLPKPIALGSSFSLELVLFLWARVAKPTLQTLRSVDEPLFRV